MENVQPEDINIDKQSVGKWEIEMPAKNGKIRFKIDTGADVTVIGEQHLSCLGLSVKDVMVIGEQHLSCLGFSVKDVRKTKKSLIGPSAQKLKCLGYAVVTFTLGNKESKQICYICKDMKTALLGRPALTSLGIVSVHPHDHITCNSIDVNLADGNEFIKAFPTVFNGLGNIKGDPIHIELEEHQGSN